MYNLSDLYDHIDMIKCRFMNRIIPLKENQTYNETNCEINKDCYTYNLHVV